MNENTYITDNIIHIQLIVIQMTQNFMRGLELIKLFHYNNNINRNQPIDKYHITDNLNNSFRQLIDQYLRHLFANLSLDAINPLRDLETL